MSDSCYVELLLRGLGNKERGELIKAQVLRDSRTPYRVGVNVLVSDDDGDVYPAKIIRVRRDNGRSYVDVAYEAHADYNENIEE